MRAAVDAPAAGHHIERRIARRLARLRAELVDVHMPAGASVSFDKSPVIGLEHHLWMIDGALDIEVEGSRFRLRTGDCLRYVLAGASRFHGVGKRGARYLVAIVHP